MLSATGDGDVVPVDEIECAQAVTANAAIATDSERTGALALDREGQRPARCTDTMIESL